MKGISLRERPKWGIDSLTLHRDAFHEEHSSLPLPKKSTKKETSRKRKHILKKENTKQKQTQNKQKGGNEIKNKYKRTN